jgi:signal transduction histidine kinase
VDFVVQRAGDDAVCRIADRGCGIPEADQKRLFQAFHRGSNVRQIPGTGLGLLIVQRCVSLHVGEIHFQSIEGDGTTFTVRLPLFRLT